MLIEVEDLTGLDLFTNKRHKRLSLSTKNECIMLILRRHKWYYLEKTAQIF